jgi:hypothetical protein
MVSWPSGQALVCKTRHAGSIPAEASMLSAVDHRGRAGAHPPLIRAACQDRHLGPRLAKPIGRATVNRCGGANDAGPVRRLGLLLLVMESKHLGQCDLGSASH